MSALDKIRGRYSKLLNDLINQCLNVKPDNRISLATTLSYLSMRKTDADMEEQRNKQQPKLPYRSPNK